VIKEVCPTHLTTFFLPPTRHLDNEGIGLPLKTYVKHRVLIITPLPRHLRSLSFGSAPLVPDGDTRCTTAPKRRFAFNAKDVKAPPKIYDWLSGKTMSHQLRSMQSMQVDVEVIAYTSGRSHNPPLPSNPSTTPLPTLPKSLNPSPSPCISSSVLHHPHSIATLTAEISQCRRRTNQSPPR